MSNITKSKKKLRQQLRTLRQQLTTEQQKQAAERLYQVVSQQSVWVNSHHIAVYIANDGEINPRPLAELAWKLGKHIYLPALDPDKAGHLLFLPWYPDTFLATNRFGTLEPKRFDSEPLDIEKFDLMLLPLTGFDSGGRRLGMGGGFYDRTLEKIADIPSIYTAGLAHECQKVERIPTDAWDVPLSAIYTDRRSYHIA